MNKVNLIGRTTHDIELRYTQSAEPLAVVRFSFAVNRKKKNETDFITCTAFGKTAETIHKYVSKGSQIGLSGRIQTGNYEKDGKKVYTFEVVVEDFTFCGKKEDSSYKLY